MLWRLQSSDSWGWSAGERQHLPCDVTCNLTANLRLPRAEKIRSVIWERRPLNASPKVQTLTRSTHVDHVTETLQKVPGLNPEPSLDHWTKGPGRDPVALTEPFGPHRTMERWNTTSGGEGGQVEGMKFNNTTRPSTQLGHQHNYSPSRKTRLWDRIIQRINSQSPHNNAGAAFFQICPTFTEKIADFRAKYVGLAWFHNPRIFVAKKSHIFVTCSTYIVEKCCVYFTQEQPFPPVAIGMLWSDVITRRHQKAAFFACSRIFRKFP